MKYVVKTWPVFLLLGILTLLWCVVVGFGWIVDGYIMWDILGRSLIVGLPLVAIGFILAYFDEKLNP